MSRFLKNLITMCCATALCFLLSLSAMANDFPIYSTWAEDDVSEAKDAGLIPFELYGDCRRAMHREWAAAFLVKLVEIATNKPIQDYDTEVFTDVATYNSNFDAINKAYVIGITKGTGDGTEFEPFRDVTREEYAVMLCRSFTYIELALGREILVESSGLALFSDRDEVSRWATEALGSLTSVGLFKGTDVETIAPDDTISIEQAIILSYRSLSFIRSSEAT